LKEPQALAPLQFAVQITPAPVGSLLTWAVSGMLALIISVVGGGVVKTKSTAIGAASTVSVTLLVCDGLLVTVAVIVMVLPIGTVDGAVYMVAAPPAVCAGVRVPQAPLLMLPVTALPPQIIVQSTPALTLSPEGIMLSDILEATARALMLPELPPALAMVIEPAFADAAELPPQPAISMPATRAQIRTVQIRTVQISTAVKAWAALPGFWGGEAGSRGTTRWGDCNMARVSYSFSF
jgi:hypothetical protein